MLHHTPSRSTVLRSSPMPSRGRSECRGRRGGGRDLNSPQLLEAGIVAGVFVSIHEVHGNSRFPNPRAGMTRS